MQKGWICIHRKIRECFIWNEEPYDKAHAWIDLLLRANHEDKKMMMNGQVKIISRGQFHTSIAILAEQWKWSRNKVYRFLDVLKNENMISVESNKGGTSNGTTITIVNYGIYQDKEESDETSNETSDGTTNDTSDDTSGGTSNDTSNGTSDGTQTTMNNNENNYNNSNNYNNENNENNYIYKDIENEKQPPSVAVTSRENYQEIVDEYNVICVSLPKVYKLSDKRKKTVKALLKTYTRDDVTTVFEKAETSDFLSGRNQKWTSCGFDWLINPTNFLKVLEGNYDNKGSSVSSGSVADFIKGFV